MACTISTLEYTVDPLTDKIVERVYSTEDVTFHGNGSWKILQVDGSTIDVNECHFGEPRVDSYNRSVFFVRFGQLSDYDKSLSKHAYKEYIRAEISKVGLLLDGLQNELETWSDA